MIKLNLDEAKTRLSYYLRKLRQGETILLCRRNVPIAEIRPLPPRRKTKRSIGSAKGKFKVNAKFFEPLPADVVDSFYGRVS
jgi:antitoxin (DNA-binding transcriptional repressor) of toxin-antitoxin stability system